MRHIQETLEVDIPIRTVYNQWTQFEDFPYFMSGVEAVHQLDARHVHWVAHIAGVRREWDAEIVEQIPDTRVAWRNIDGTTNGGAVNFEQVTPHATKITLVLDFEPSGLIENVGDKLGIISAQARSDLERFRTFITERGAETGAWRGEIGEGGDDQDGADSPHRQP